MHAQHHLLVILPSLAAEASLWGRLAGPAGTAAPASAQRCRAARDGAGAPAADQARRPITARPTKTR